MKRTERHYLYFELPGYLHQWLMSWCGDGGDVIFPRSSIEHKLLSVYLKCRPGDAAADIGKDDETRVVIPHFAGRDPKDYNWLGPKARTLLVNTMMNRFDVEMWSALVKIPTPGQTAADALEAWLELKGIEPSERNCIAVAQRLRRLKKRYAARQRQYRHRKKALKNMV